jgi:hypothetical protein
MKVVACKISAKRKRVTAAASTSEANKHAKTDTVAVAARREATDAASPSGTTTTASTTSTTSTNNSEYVPLSEWSKLSPEERKPAKALGFSQPTWDDFCYMGCFSSKLEGLSTEQKAAVEFLFKGVWPPEYSGFESNLTCCKVDAKAGTFFTQDGTSFRYFLIRSTDGRKGDAIRVKENKEEKTCGCPFCNIWYKVQGISMHMKSCPKNSTETNTKNGNKRKS